MKQFLLFLSVLFCAVMPMKGTNIDFEQSSWDAILEQAQIRQLPIFVEVYADYCMPCKMMEKEVFSDAELAHFFNQNFINYKVDLQAEIGKMFSVMYDVRQLPTLLFLDTQGNLIVQTIGVKSKSELVEIGENIVNSPKRGVFNINTVVSSISNNEKNIKRKTEEQRIESQIEEKKSSRKTPPNPPVFFDDYIQEAKDIDSRISKLKAVQKWHSDIYLAEIYKETHNMKSNAVDWLVKDLESFNRLFGKKEVQEKIFLSGERAIQWAIQTNDKALVKKACSVIEKIDYPYQNQVRADWMAEYLASTNDWKAFAILFYNQREEITMKSLLEAGWTLQQNTDNRKSLKITRCFVEKQKELTYLGKDFKVLEAHLNESLGKKRKAKKIAMKMLSMPDLGIKNKIQLEELLQRLGNQ